MKLEDIRCTQDAFDYVVSNLIAQGRGSFDMIESSNVSCRYRDSNGNKCAAGWLIPDNQYSEGFEGDAAFCTLIKTQFWKERLYPYIRPEYEQFHGMIEGLQNAHDDTACATCIDFVEGFKLKAEKIAAAFNLKWKFGGT